MSELHVVLGGSGGVGRAVITRLAQQGKQVRAVNRSGQIDDLPDGVEIMGADVLNRDEVVAACDGAAVVYHCVHPKKDYSQFDRPFIIDHSKFEKVFGAHTTPHKEAIAQTVNWARANGGI